MGVTQVPRSRGAACGVLLIILGAWGGLAPFVGHYVHLAFTQDTGWHLTSGRLYLSVIPGAVALVGGLLAVAATHRGLGGFGAFIAALGGAWFIVGQGVTSTFMASSSITQGTPVGGSLGSLSAAQRGFVETLAYFTGVGILILFFAALGLGRFSVVGVRDAELAAEDQEAERTEALQPDMTYPTTPGQYPADTGGLRGPGS